MMPLRKYVRARLHRRIFVWFGASILVTSLSFTVVHAIVDGIFPPPWRQEFARVNRFVGNQFAEKWEEPAARDALMHAMARDLDIVVMVLDPQRNTITATGDCSSDAHCRHTWFTTDVVRDGRLLGYITICGQRDHHAYWMRLLPALLLAAFVLWAASGKIARRLARPLEDIAKVASDIGAGKLASRMELGCREPGEVGQLADAINDMAAKIERQMSDQRELLAAVSHELRTPLARLRILAELARGSGADARTLDEIDREVIEIDALVGDLLANSRLEFHALTLHPLSPRELALRALERAGLEPTLLTDEAAGAAIHGDATLLSRALANVIENARHHGKGLRTLRIRRREGFVAFEAEDSGEGFAPGEEARMFEKFVYSDKQPGKDRVSLGLGLALVRRIAEAHGGTAYAQNRNEGGARVGFEVACSPANANVSAA